MARERVMETTAYCNCGKCCCWEHGMMVTPRHYVAAQTSLPFVKLRKRRKNPHYHPHEQKSFVFDKYWTATSLKGCAYEGKTADGDLPRQARPGPLHPRSFRRPLRLALRVAFAPWFLLGRQGTIAADLQEYPFGTRMYVPGYGWGLVKDCGSAIKGPDRLDLFFNRHVEALQWGRQSVKVKVVPPRAEWVDKNKFLKNVKPIRGAVKAIDRGFHAIFSG